MDENKKTVNTGSKVPTFTPPTPSFTPPKKSVNGPTCYYHKDEPAVAKCEMCGKPLCEECCDSFKFVEGPYSGHNICIDCIDKLVEQDKQQLKQNYSKIKTLFITTLIGVALGLIYGLFATISDLVQNGFSFETLGGGLLMSIVIAAIFGCVVNYIKNLFHSIPNWFTNLPFTDNVVINVCIVVVNMIYYLIKEAIRAIFVTASKIINYSLYLKRTKNVIESSEAAMQSLRDYMEYTLVREQNVGVDIDTLLKQDSALANNSFARMVKEQGEESAAAVMHNCVASINENGEIIRSFREDDKVAA